MNKTYVKYSKLFFKEETEALEKAIKTLGVEASKIVTNHSTTHWVFELAKSEKMKPLLEETKEGSSKVDGIFTAELPSNDDKDFYVKKDIEPDFATARKLAKEHFNTFEGNIKKVEETETYFKFQKVR